MEDPVAVLHGVGPSIERKLNHLGIYTLADMLFHLPYRYIDRTRLTPIVELQSGRHAYVHGAIELTQVKYGKRRSLLCRIGDGTGTMVLRFFYFSRSRQNLLRQGRIVCCYGQVRGGAHSLEMVHPECRIVDAPKDIVLEPTLTPVYPTTEGLQQNKLRGLLYQVLEILSGPDEDALELLPDRLLQELKVMNIVQALLYVHRPPPNADIGALQTGMDDSHKRLAFEELLSRHLGLKLARNQYRSVAAPLFNEAEDLIAGFVAGLPFTLTAAQQRAFKIIRADLVGNVPMLRLLQGDVGSGKTVVAALGVLQAIASGYQAAMMAPTELLAEQHFNTLSAWFEPLSIPVIYLSGKLSKSDHAEQLCRIAEDRPLLVVGTHALFQEKVRFHRLGLIIIDEQHRFGVKQRFALFAKAGTGDLHPHQLLMTATPIPRTLAMTAYADLDIAVIDELPPGRLVIRTSVISNQRRREIIGRISEVCQQNRQVYWVCTLIEYSESLSCQTAIETQQELHKQLPALRIGIIHGRMSSHEKEQTMDKFKSGELHILVATTIIEVGVDVPNASLMIIENAERLGLLQLHQIRGRIGRGKVKSDCVLMYQPPLTELARNRLDTLRKTSNGFEIAEKDFDLRGPGELLGERQTGLPDLRVADLIRDKELLKTVHGAAEVMISSYPHRIQPLLNRWLGQSIHYSNV